MHVRPPSSSETERAIYTLHLMKPVASVTSLLKYSYHSTVIYRSVMYKKCNAIVCNNRSKFQIEAAKEINFVMLQNTQKANACHQRG